MQNLEQLTREFDELQINNKKMPNEREDVRVMLEQVLIKLKVSEDRQKVSEEQIAGLTNNLSKFQVELSPTEHEDIATEIRSGDQIQLDSYKSIPEFSGERGEYRSWREQVTRRMHMIENFKTHPKYEAALGIIRSKITKSASDILINNSTAYNIDAIIDRLDFSYADQRPLYVVEAELTSIKQANKPLQEFYDAINQALNIVITKIVMSYKNEREQTSLITETKLKAVRAFIMGLKNPTMRNILYGHAPKTLSQAFAIAQTVYYDDQYLHLDQHRDQNRNHKPMPHHPPMRGHPNFNYTTVQRPMPPKNKPEPMDIDTSNRFRPPTNWHQQTNQRPNHPPNQPPNLSTNMPQKRDYNSSRQHGQQQHKFQRINRMTESEMDPNDGYEGDICGEIPDDLISHDSHTSDASNTASTFLGE